MGLRAHRRLSPVARATEPLAFADDYVNAVSDWNNRWFGWAWWPAKRPDPRQPIGPDVHVVYLAQKLVFTFATDWLVARSDHLPSGRELRRDRALQAVVTPLFWAVTTGAWERRARRRRWSLP